MHDRRGARRIRQAGGTALVMAAAFAASGCRDGTVSAEGTPLPRRLAALSLVEVRRGPAAAAVMRRLHDRDVAPDSSWVGAYADGDRRAVLYVSRYHTAADAEGQLDAMSERIGAGTGAFGHHRTFTIGDRTLHATLSPGTVHYFFALERTLLWVSVPPELATGALAELLGIPADSIPRARGPERPPTG